MDTRKQLSILVIIHVLLIIQQARGFPRDCYIRNIKFSGFVHGDSILVTPPDELKQHICNNIEKALQHTELLGKYVNCEVQDIQSRHAPIRGTVDLDFIHFDSKNQGAANLKIKLVSLLNATAHTKYAYLSVDNNTRIRMTDEVLCGPVINEVLILMKRRLENELKNGSNYETVYLNGDVKHGFHPLYKEAALLNHTSSRFQTVQEDICQTVSEMIRSNKILEQLFVNCSVIDFYGDRLRAKVALTFKGTHQNGALQEVLVNSLHHLDHPTNKYNLGKSITVSGCNQPPNVYGFLSPLLVIALSSLMLIIH